LTASFLYAVVALCVPAPVLAQEPLPSATCQRAETSLRELELTNRQLNAQIAVLEAFNAGEKREAIGVADLQQLFESNAQRESLPADTRCAQLRDEYEAAFARVATQREELTALREAYLESLPIPARLGLERLRTSGERVVQSARTLRGLLDQEHLASVRGDATEYLELLDTLRGEYLGLLPSLSGEVDAADVRA
jgi:hypothetical protein